MVTDRWYKCGLDVYVSQFAIPREQVVSWFADRVGARFGEESIRSGAGAWVDDELSLRERSLVVVAALIYPGRCRAAAPRPHPLGRPPRLHAGAARGARGAPRRLCRLPARREWGDGRARGTRQARGAGRSGDDRGVVTTNGLARRPTRARPPGPG